MLPVVVLAGGLATRLRPVTEQIPKSLISIKGIPFVIHQLTLFQKKGISEVHFCLGYLGEQVEHAVKSSRFHNEMHISYTFDGEKLLGTGGAIINAFPFLPEHFFVMYGDSYLDISYQDVESYYIPRSSDAKGLMTIFHNKDQWDKSNVIFRNHELLLYSKRESHPDMEYIDYGLGILTKKNFESVNPQTSFDLAEVYSRLSRERKLIGYEVFQRFYEIGSFKGIEDFNTYLNNSS
jgi:NDP-sugar pyrophosphorylase family protein